LPCGTKFRALFPHDERGAIDAGGAYTYRPEPDPRRIQVARAGHRSADRICLPVGRHAGFSGLKRIRRIRRRQPRVGLEHVADIRHFAGGTRRADANEASLDEIEMRLYRLKVQRHVRFVSSADLAASPRNVRFTTDSGSRPSPDQSPLSAQKLTKAALLLGSVFHPAREYQPRFSGILQFPSMTDIALG
jgi:hypothetical protein